jgi:membrane protease YdiL (CAAX protease family)
VTENKLSYPSTRYHPLYVIILTFITMLICFTLVGPLIGLLLSLPFYEGSFIELGKAIQHPNGVEALKIPFYFIQGAATLFGFIIGPALLLYVLRRSVFDFFRDQSIQLPAIALTGLIVIVFMGLNSFFIEWNAHLHFPGFLKNFEEWAQEKEDIAKELTTFLTKFNSTGQFLFAFVVIAVLPAIGEELVFRGLIQRELGKVVNMHAAILIAAFLFSLFHMQFFGFIPRLFLGALFGYLYYWSGNLSLAMLAHFINNGVAVIGIYFYQKGAIELDVESAEAFPWPYVIASALLTALLLYYFKKYHRERPSSSEL